MAFTRAATHTLLASVLLGAIIPTLSTSARAQAAPGEQRRAYRIDAGGLNAALLSFGAQAGVLIASDPAVTSGVQSPGVDGVMTVKDGLAALLRGTGLEALPERDGFRLVRVPAPAVTQLNAVTVVGRAGATENTGSFTTSSATVGGKTAQALREVPQSVSVITRQEIEDRHLVSLNDVMSATPGIAIFQGAMLSSNYLSRGFAIGNMRVDGGASVYRSFGADDDMAFYDHVEVLRGADGLFGGANEAGGTINLVRKKPTPELQIIAQAQVGSWNYKRTDLDVSGPLTENGKLRARGVLAYEDKDFFYQVAHSRRTLGYGILEADLTSDTTAYIGASYQKRDSSYQGYGLPRYATGEDLKLPRDTYLSGADDKAVKTIVNVFGHVTQRLWGDWSANLDINQENSRQDRFDHYFSGAIDPLTGGGLFDAASDQNERFKNTSIDLSANGSFGLWGRRHQVVVGASWERFRPNSYGAKPSNRGQAVDDIFTFDPDDYPRSTDFIPMWYQATDIRQSGLYGSLRMHLADPVHVIVGGRLSRYDYTFTNQNLNAAGAVQTSSVTKYQDNNVVTPYVAATFDLNETWTTYASVAETFKSQANSLQGPAPGSPLDPVTGRNYEIGLKGEHLDGKLHSAFAIYQIERKNAAVRDTAYPASNAGNGNTCCFLPNGNIVSKGFDAELSGELAPGVQLTASYNYNQNRDRNATGGSYQPLTPKHMAKIFATYQLPGDLHRWKLGGGVSIQSATYVSGSAFLRNADGSLSKQSTPYKFTQPGYAIWNAFAEYQISDNWAAQLNVNNLFDKTYYSTVGYLDYGNFYGAPRNAALTIRGRF
ncbi:TonB-dependent siderophore receptor [Achromobacter seleniivolatilans]|uniref:TonB-dependent siderophore receptor n=1 Tax=Achromobacter seleniivolatilans TaxID=3047478 RepID=A0ABY9M143_9BURK|nr:TonB-dependent receptor [Achromobacter sp. R39]WMD20284.1 TonB-dependent siderophore receptor [Achromobacter sp. R39]